MVRIIKIKQGFTLIELVLYMSIFTVLVSGVLYSSFYLQEILQNSSIEYKVKQDIYGHLELLQQHAKTAAKVEYSTSSILLFNKYGYITQSLVDGNIEMKYEYPNIPEKTIAIFPYTKFEEFSFFAGEFQNTFLSKSVLYMNISWKSHNHAIRLLEEYILVPPVDFSLIP